MIQTGQRIIIEKRFREIMIGVIILIGIGLFIYLRRIMKKENRMEMLLKD